MKNKFDAVTESVYVPDGNQTRGVFMITIPSASGILGYLFAAEAALPELLKHGDGWQSRFINYEHPHVERLWRPWQDNHRLSLHRIHPCEPGQAFTHHHNWAAAFRVSRGAYELLISSGPDVKMCSPPVRVILTEGSCYVMDHPEHIHSVRPLDAASLSVMVSARPWGHGEEAGEIPQQRHLTADESWKLFSEFREIYR